MAYMRTPSYGMHAKKHMNHVHLLDAPNRTVGSSAHHFKVHTAFTTMAYHSLCYRYCRVCSHLTCRPYTLLAINCMVPFKHLSNNPPNQTQSKANLFSTH